MYRMMVAGTPPPELARTASLQNLCLVFALASGPVGLSEEVIRLGASGCLNLSK